MIGFLRPLVSAFVYTALAASASGGGMAVKLIPSVDSPAPVATKVTWTAEVTEASQGTLWFRFRSRAMGFPFEVIRDFGPESSLEWTASETEGIYEVEVTVRNLNTGEDYTTTSPFQFTSRVTGGTPVVNPTANSLVYLYSAAACPGEGRMRVQFQSSDGVTTLTPFKPCHPDSSMNFYLVGLKANTAYTARHSLDTGTSFVQGPDVTFQTTDIAFELAPYTVLKAPVDPTQSGVLLQSTLSQMTVATDLAGNLIWYYPGAITSLTRPSEGGRFLGIYQSPLVDASHEYFREFDAAGFTLKETNAARVTEQLTLMGIHPITGFHHEARRLPDGKIAVLASSERMMSDIQGPGEVNILGDTIVVLDNDLNVVWAWDSFDHLDLARMATQRETCTPVGGGCPPFHNSEIANDWLHGNSLQQTPEGDFLYSARHQDWLIRIDYRFGEGSGNVVWRLGKDGDFQAISDDPSPWFSHQHDGGFTPGGSTITVFDNGNLRYESDPGAHSRGQAWAIDETSRTATLKVNVDLGVYSFALGSAYLLPNGGYHFNLGWQQGSGSARSVEVDASGILRYSVEVAAPVYRTFRLKDLYTPPNY